MKRRHPASHLFLVPILVASLTLLPGCINKIAGKFGRGVGTGLAEGLGKKEGPGPAQDIGIGIGKGFLEEMRGERKIEFEGDEVKRKELYNLGCRYLNEGNIYGAEYVFARATSLNGYRKLAVAYLDKGSSDCLEKKVGIEELIEPYYLLPGKTYAKMERDGYDFKHSSEFFLSMNPLPFDITSVEELVEAEIEREQLVSELQDYDAVILVDSYGNSLHHHDMMTLINKLSENEELAVITELFSPINQEDLDKYQAGNLSLRRMFIGEYPTLIRTGYESLLETLRNKEIEILPGKPDLNDEVLAESFEDLIPYYKLDEVSVKAAVSAIEQGKKPIIIANWVRAAENYLPLRLKQAGINTAIVEYLPSLRTDKEKYEQLREVKKGYGDIFKAEDGKYCVAFPEQDVLDRY